MLCGTTSRLTLFEERACTAYLRPVIGSELDGSESDPSSDGPQAISDCNLDVKCATIAPFSVTATAARTRSNIS